MTLFILISFDSWMRKQGLVCILTRIERQTILKDKGAACTRNLQKTGREEIQFTQPYTDKII